VASGRAPVGKAVQYAPSDQGITTNSRLSPSQGADVRPTSWPGLLFSTLVETHIAVPGLKALPSRFAGVDSWVP